MRPRWTHTCAWNGHELGDGAYLQVSPHERVCPAHQSAFQIWLDDKSKRMYRIDGEALDSEIEPSSSTGA